MNRTALHRILFFAAMSVASSTFAGSDVVKCVSTDGHVTLTDEPCQGGELSVSIPAANEAIAAPATVAPPPATAVASRAPSIRHIILQPQDLRHDTWVSKGPAQRSLATDVATLKAARMNMAAMDSATAIMRQQRIAGNN